MDIWTLTNVGDENLYLEPEDRNEYDKNAVAVIIDGKTGGHIPKNLSRTFKHFLALLNYILFPEMHAIACAVSLRVQFITHTKS